jgi:signal transduction histidine kinase
MVGYWQGPLCRCRKPLTSRRLACFFRSSFSMSAFADQAFRSSETADLFAPDDFVQALFEVAPGSLMLLKPVYEAGRTDITDWAFGRLNAQAQALLGLPEFPTPTFWQHHALATQASLFAFCRDSYLGQPTAAYTFQTPAADYRAAARRCGQCLVVSLTEVATPPSTTQAPAHPTAPATPASSQRQELQQLREALTAQAQQLARAQAEFSTERARMNHLFTQASVAICVLNGPDLVYELVSAGYQQMFPGRHLQGLPLLKALPELTGLPAADILFEVYQTGETRKGVNVCRHIAPYEGGPLKEFYFDYILQARTDAQGQIDGVLVFAIEVTEQVLSRQRTEALQAEALAAAEQLVTQRQAFNQVFEHTPAAIAILRGPDHTLDYYNSTYERLFPGRGDMRGQTIAQIQPEAVAQGFVALLDKVYQTGKTFIGQELLLSIAQPDGRPPQDTYFDFTYQAFQEGGQTVGISAFAFDVTERVAARRQQVAQQMQLTQLFAQAPVAIAILRGPLYIIEVANQLVADIWGRSPEQLLGLPLFEALPEVQGQGFEEILDQVVTTGEAFVAQEVPAMLEREGKLEKVYLNFVYQPLPDEHGLLTSIAAVATNVSEQVAARYRVEATQQQVQRLNEELAATNHNLQASNKELADANQQLRHINADLDNFIYTASHDLKSPISNIEGLVQALREELALPPAESQVPALLDFMQGSVERFKRTIGDLTDVTKLQKAHDQPVAVLDLAAVVAEVCLDLQLQLNAAGGQFVVELPPGQTLAFSEKNLRSVLYNLLSNALKYRHPARRPVVQLRAYPQGAGLMLEVHDNGLGVAADAQHKLFGMFQRLHDHVEGSGIGLYMVRKIMDNAGGHIEVESELDVGSTFRVFFPG